MSKTLFLKKPVNLISSFLFSFTILSSEVVYGMNVETSQMNEEISSYLKISKKEIFYAFQDMFNVSKDEIFNVSKYKKENSDESSPKNFDVPTAFENLRKHIDFDDQDSEQSFIRHCISFVHVKNNSDKISEESLLEVAEEYRNMGYFEFAITLFTQLVEKGNGEALRQLGEMYNNGEGVTCDPLQALSYFKRAIKKESSNAMVDLARLYIDGTYTPENPKEVEQLYKRARELNNVDAIDDIEYGMLDNYGPKKAKKLDEFSTPKYVHLQEKSNVTTSWDALQLNFENVNIDK
jgi:tetratricopeptide (TPR) repeat protein